MTRLNWKALAAVLSATAAALAIIESDTAGAVRDHRLTIGLTISAVVVLIALLFVSLLLVFRRPKVIDRPDDGPTERFFGEDLTVLIERNTARIPALKNIPLLRVIPAEVVVTDAPQGFTDFHPWSEKHGAIDAKRSMLRITVQGVSDSAAVVTGLRLKVLQRQSAPQMGIPVRRPTAGATELRNLQIDLDADDAEACWVEAGSPDKGVAFTVGKDEIEIFDVTGLISDGLLSWQMELTYTCAGTQRVLTFPETARPLQTVGMDLTTWYDWPFTDAWVRCKKGAPIEELPGGQQLEPVSLAT